MVWLCLALAVSGLPPGANAVAPGGGSPPAGATGCSQCAASAAGEEAGGLVPPAPCERIAVQPGGWRHRPPTGDACSALRGGTWMWCGAGGLVPPSPRPQGGTLRGGRCRARGVRGASGSCSAAECVTALPGGTGAPPGAACIGARGLPPAARAGAGGQVPPASRVPAAGDRRRGRARAGATAAVLHLLILAAVGFGGCMLARGYAPAETPPGARGAGRERRRALRRKGRERRRRVGRCPGQVPSRAGGRTRRWRWLLRWRARREAGRRPRWRKPPWWKAWLASAWEQALQRAAKRARRRARNRAADVALARRRRPELRHAPLSRWAAAVLRALLRCSAAAEGGPTPAARAGDGQRGADQCRPPCGAVPGSGAGRRRLRSVTRSAAALLLAAVLCLVVWRAGLLGVRVGEAALPGHPWVVTTANVTALSERTRPLVTALGGSIIALQEVKLTKAGQQAMGKRLWHDGWQVAWGQAQPPAKREGQLDRLFAAEARGVAIMVRRGLPMQPGPIDTPLRRRLWTTGRWSHCVVGMGNGAQALHVMTVYGHTGAADQRAAYDLNERLLGDVMEASAELGNVPVLVLGDFNITPVGSQVLRSAMAAGGWEDLAVAQAEAVQAEPEPTCFSALAHQSGSPGSRIDIAFGNPAVLAAARTVQVLPDTGLQVHRPVQVELDMAAYSQRVCQVHKPLAFPVERWVKWEQEECDQAAAAAADAVQPRWRAALLVHDVEELWRLFNEAAEGYLAVRSRDLPDFAGGAPRRYRGRGRCQEGRLKHLAAHQRNGTDGALTVVQRRVERLVGQLRELRRQLARELDAGPAHVSGEVRCLWDAARRLGREIVPDEPYAARWARAEPPSVDGCCTLLAETTRRAEVLHRRIRAERGKRWREWVADSWQSARGKLYAWCKGTQSTPVHMLRRGDRCPTANVVEMDELLRGAWGPIFRKHAVRLRDAKPGMLVVLTPPGLVPGVAPHRMRGRVEIVEAGGALVRWESAGRQVLPGRDPLPEVQWVPRCWWEADGHAVAEPCWERYVDRFGEYVATAPMRAPRLDAPRLRDVLRRMRKGQAGGMEGWRVAELKALPDPMLELLAELLN
eukprot:gene19027-biopygen9786